MKFDIDQAQFPVTLVLWHMVIFFQLFSILLEDCYSCMFAIGVATFCHDRVTPIKAEDKIHLPVEQCESDDLTAEENCLTQGKFITMHEMNNSFG